VKIEVLQDQLSDANYRGDRYKQRCTDLEKQMHAEKERCNALKEEFANKRNISVVNENLKLKMLNSLHSDLHRLRKLRINMKLEVDVAGLEQAEGILGEWINIGNVRM